MALLSEEISVMNAREKNIIDTMVKEIHIIMNLWWYLLEYAFEFQILDFNLKAIITRLTVS